MYLWTWYKEPVKVHIFKRQSNSTNVRDGLRRKLWRRSRKPNSASVSTSHPNIRTTSDVIKKLFTFRNSKTHEKDSKNTSESWSENDLMTPILSERTVSYKIHTSINNTFRLRIKSKRSYYGKK